MEPSPPAAPPAGPPPGTDAARAFAAELVARARTLFSQAGQEDDARLCLRQALALDPDSADAAEPLADFHVARGDHAAAEPLLNVLLRAWRGRRSALELRPLHLRLAGTYERLERLDDALRWLRVALQTDPGDPLVARKLADIHFLRGEWTDALPYYQRVLVQHGDRLAGPDKAEVYHRIGGIKERQNERPKALNMWQKALQADPRHRPALESIAAYHRQDEDWPNVVDYKTRIVGIAGDDERFDLLREIAELRKTRLGDPEKALQAYADALDIRPGDKRTLIDVLDVLRETGQWSRAIDACRKVIDVEDDPKRIASGHLFVAAAHRDHLGDDDRAIAHYDLALDADPDNLTGMQAIEQILVARQDWTSLEAAYRRMLGRLPESGKAELRDTLLMTLAVLARDKLGDLEKAVGCYRDALPLNPKDAGRREALAAVYVRLPGRWADAAAQHLFLLRNDPRRLPSYHALLRIYHDAGRADEAWCVCAALAFLERADPRERGFYERHRSRQGPAVRGAVTPEAWDANLRHPDEDPEVDALLGPIAAALAQTFAIAPKTLGLRPEDRQDPGRSGLALARALAQASAALGIPAPALYALPDRPGGLAFTPAEPPSAVAGKDVLAGFEPAEVRFVAAHHLAFYRPACRARFLAHAAAEKARLSPDVAALAFLHAAVRLGDPENAGPPVEPAAEFARRVEPHLHPLQRDLIRPIAHRLALHPPASLGPWIAGTELTADRAGLLLCGDLAVAAAAITKLPPSPVGLSTARRTDELLAFWLSEDHFLLRRQLGTALADAEPVASPAGTDGIEVDVDIDAPVDLDDLPVHVEE
jgi:tetratricopeptide (TPR) repeat protein